MLDGQDGIYRDVGSGGLRMEHSRPTYRDLAFKGSGSTEARAGRLCIVGSTSVELFVSLFRRFIRLKPDLQLTYSKKERARRVLLMRLVSNR